MLFSRLDVTDLNHFDFQSNNFNFSNLQYSVSLSLSSNTYVNKKCRQNLVKEFSKMATIIFLFIYILVSLQKSLNVLKCQQSYRVSKFWQDRRTCCFIDKWHFLEIFIYSIFTWLEKALKTSVSEIAKIRKNQVKIKVTTISVA